nr:HepT-like ribonuclease domain-containing protein [uncultured Methanobrevibacter sp.]
MEVIPWCSIKDMRNIMIHKYESAEFDVMEYALTVEVPELKEDLVKLKNINL